MTELEFIYRRAIREQGATASVYAFSGYASGCIRVSAEGRGASGDITAHFSPAELREIANACAELADMLDSRGES